jgi:hypothetical protein
MLKFMKKYALDAICVLDIVFPLLSAAMCMVDLKSFINMYLGTEIVCEDPVVCDTLLSHLINTNSVFINPHVHLCTYSYCIMTDLSSFGVFLVHSLFIVFAQFCKEFYFFVKVLSVLTVGWGFAHVVSIFVRNKTVCVTHFSWGT